MIARLALPLAIVSVVLIVLFLRRRAPKPRAPWAEWPDDDRDMLSIARYARARAAAHQTVLLDDRTWDDLNMDDVFRVLDRAESLLGQQALYVRLRSSPTAAHLDEFDALTTRFGLDLDGRRRAQRALARMRGVDGHDVLWLAAPGSFKSEPWHVVFPILGATTAVTLAASIVYPVLLFAVGIGSIASLVLRATVAPQLRTAGAAFRQVGALLGSASQLRPLVNAEGRAITGAIETDLPRLSRLRRIASWAGRETTGAASGDPAALIIEYLNLLFSLDGNAIYLGSREVRARADELARVVQSVGEIDAALSIASYRAQTSGWTRPTFREAGSRASLIGVRHPLLPGAVPNTVTLEPPHGMIITGSNMSGKTTFLRTLGVTVQLAQTIRMCLAERYEAPPFVVRSCIGRADDPATGKSYYLVEVETVLGLVRAAESASPHLFLFDELFRGTNTVERVAAGEAVLRALLAPRPDASPAPHVVLAATHDQELVDLLRGVYAAHHFSDAVDDNGMTFDYQLREGAAHSRNAIALLKLRGAPTGLVAYASARAKQLALRHGT